MATIPLDQIVDVLPGTVSAGGTGVSMCMLILTQNTALTSGLRVFYDSASVVTFFGAMSNEAAMATVYFDAFLNKTQTPAKLLFFRAVVS